MKKSVFLCCTVHGRLLSILGRKYDGRGWKSLVDSGSSINLMEEDSIIKIDQAIIEMRKNSITVNNKHVSQEITYLRYFGNKHLFRLFNNDFSLPGDGIIGLTFFQKYEWNDDRMIEWMIENNKMPLIGDGNYVPVHIAHANKINLMTPSANQDV